MDKYMPYVVTIVCALISGVVSYLASRKQLKTDLEKLEKQHAFDIEKEREKFAMEKERIELEHKHQIELIEKKMENQIGVDLVSTLAKEYARSPAGQAQFRNTGNKKRK